MRDPAFAITEDNPQLAEHFWLDEFHCRSGVAVPEELIPALRDFVVNNLVPIRTFFNAPMIITSAYRTPEHNRNVGGVPRSRHMYDTFGGEEFAVDFIVPGYSSAEIAMTLNGLIRLGVISEGGIGMYPKFVHYDNRGYRARW